MVVSMVVGAVSVSVAVVVIAVVAVVVGTVVAVVVGAVVVIVRPGDFGSDVVTDVASSAMVLSVAPAARVRVAVRRVPTATSMHWCIHRWPVRS